MLRAGRATKLSGQLWSPFLNTKCSAITANNRDEFHQALARSLLATTEPDFDVMWNHRYATAEHIHGYFDAILSGFDIVDATLLPEGDKASAKGSFVLAHVRPLLGEWGPTPISEGRRILFHFKVSFEAECGLISSLNYACNLKATLAAAGCPSAALQRLDEHRLEILRVIHAQNVVAARTVEHSW